MESIKHLRFVDDRLRKQERSPDYPAVMLMPGSCPLHVPLGDNEEPILSQTPASGIKYHLSGEAVCRPSRDTRVHCEVGLGVLLSPETNVDQQSVNAKNAMNQALGFVTMISWCGRCPLSLNRTHCPIEYSLT